MKSTLKKYLAALLSVVMLVGLFPTSALAAHTNMDEGSYIGTAELYVNAETPKDPEVAEPDTNVYQNIHDNGKNYMYPYVLPITQAQYTGAEDISVNSKARVTMGGTTMNQLRGQDTLDIQNTKFMIFIGISNNLTIADSALVFNSTFLMPDEDAMNDGVTVKRLDHTSSYQSGTAVDMYWKISGDIEKLKAVDTVTPGSINDYSSITTFLTESGYLTRSDVTATAAYNLIPQMASIKNAASEHDITLYAIPVKMNWEEVLKEAEKENISLKTDYTYTAGDEDSATGGKIYANFTAADWQCPMELTAVTDDGTIKNGIDLTFNSKKVTNSATLKENADPDWTDDFDHFIPTKADTYNGELDWYYSVDAMPLSGDIVGTMYQYNGGTTSTLIGSVAGIPAGTILLQFVPATPGTITVTKTIEGLSADDQDKLPKNLEITITDQKGNPALDLNGNKVTATIGDNWTYNSKDGKWTATATINNLRPSDETYGWDYQYTVKVAAEDGIDGYKQSQAPTISKNESIVLENQYTLERDENGAVTYTEADGDKANVMVISKYTKNEPVEWNTSKSKTATNLDSNYKSQVTLSLPSAEEKLVSDVVFVLDESSCSEPVKTEVSELLQNLYQQIEDTNATIKIGAVQFRGNVTELPLTELTAGTQNQVTSFMSTRPTTGGSNMSAGLLAGKAMLDADTNVENSRKYLILVSDGITYIWDDESTDEQENYGINFANADTPNKPMLASPDGWDVKHGNGYVPTEWTSHLSGVEALLDTTINEKASLYVRGENLSETSKPFVAYGDKDQYTSTVDVALYKSYIAYQSIAEEYNAYSVVAGVKGEMQTYPFGPSFMQYLAGGETVSFDTIQSDIYYLLDAGSTVEDYMGYVEGDYNFDFVDDAEALTLKVGNDTLSAKKAESSVEETSTYTFGTADEDNTYPYVLTYYAGDKGSTEHFVWTINVPVSNFAPVQLTYTVKLTNPQVTAGTYGKYDTDGSKGYPGLYTNNSATLYPVDSNGDKGVPENFLKPTVSYEVKKPTKPTNPTNPTTPVTPPPALNTEDHFAYIIGYPVDYYTGEPTDDQTKKPVKPEGNITRAEVATIFFRLLTDEVRNEYWSQTCEYSDVDIDDWFNNAVCTLSNFGILRGYEDGTFRPNGNITRAEFATIAVRFFEVEYNGKDLFPDIDGHWAQDYINQAGFAGLVEGYPDGTFGPEKLITRAEAVTIVNRTIDRHPDKEHLLDDMLVWPDNMDTTKWYYADMQEATNSHEYTMHTKTAETESQTKYEIWQKILPVRDWEAFEKAWADANAAANPGEVVR